MPLPLAGCRIWLTRAAHQAQPWRTALEAAGAWVVVEPLLAIDPPADSLAAKAALARAEAADIVIATSSNAVRAAWQLRPEFAPRGRLLAIGATTAAALETASARAVLRPDGATDSETLLDQPALVGLHGQRVAVLSGEGGRRTLADTLSARGAAVDKIALYRRRWLALDAGRLAEIIACVDMVIVTSGQALSHLLDRVGEAPDGTLCARLAECRLVAPSARVVKQCQQRLDWTLPPVVVERFDGHAIVDAIAQAWSGDRQ